MLGITVWWGLGIEGNRESVRGLFHVLAAIHSALTGWPPYGIRQDAKLKKEFYQNQTYFHRFFTRTWQYKSCLKPMQQCLV